MHPADGDKVCGHGGPAADNGSINDLRNVAAGRSDVERGVGDVKQSAICPNCEYGQERIKGFYCELVRLEISTKAALNENIPCVNFAAREKPLTFDEISLRECKKVNPDNPQAVAEAISDLLEALKVAKEALQHDVPGDCWATGPLTGNRADQIVIDLIVCPGCVALNEINKAISKAEGK